MNKLSYYKENSVNLFYNSNGFKEEIQPVINTIKDKEKYEKNEGLRVSKTFFSKDFDINTITDVKDKISFKILFEDLVNKHLAFHSNIDAMNNWILNILPFQISSKTVRKGNLIFYHSDIIYLKPTIPDTQSAIPLFPFKARTENYSYYFSVYGCQYQYDTITNKTTQISSYKELFFIPCMLGSLVCHLNGYTPSKLKLVFEDSMDPLGYFIIGKGGNEKVIILQENLYYNKIITIFKKNKDIEKLDEIDDKDSEEEDNDDEDSDDNNSVEEDNFEINETHFNRNNTGGIGKNIVSFKNIETSVTLFSILGTVYLRINSKDTFPSFRLNVSSKGHKGATLKKFSIFIIFDIYLQFLDPVTFGYDEKIINSSEYKNWREKNLTEKDYLHIFSSSPSTDFIKNENRNNARYNILKAFSNLISRFTNLTNEASLILKALETSIYKYISTPPAFEVIYKKQVTDFISIAKAESNLIYEEELKKSEFEKLEEFISNIFPDMEFHAKPLFLFKMILQHISCLIGIRSFDDRDSWDNKRIKMAYENFSTIINCMFKFKIESKKKPLENNILSIIEPQTSFSGYEITISKQEITKKFEDAFGTNGFEDKPETIENLIRKNHMNAIQLSNKIIPNTKKKTRQLSIRYVQPTQLGLVCPFDTPSSGKCGINKNISCLAKMSLNRILSNYKEEILLPLLMKHSSSYKKHSNSKTNCVILNSELIGWCDASFERILRKTTKTNLNYYDVEIIFLPEEKTLQIYTIGGNLIRPVFTTNYYEIDSKTSLDVLFNKFSFKNPFKEVSVNSLIELGIIEYITSSEQSRSTIAYDLTALKKIGENRIKFPLRGIFNNRLFPVYCDVHPIGITSLQCSLMPYSNKSAGTRISYQTKMFAQSIGNFHDFYFNTFFTSFKRSESTAPLATTILASPLGFTRNPSGKMLMVGILALSDNQEDSLTGIKDSLIDYRLQKYVTLKFKLENTEGKGDKDYIKEYLSPPSKIRGGKSIPEEELIKWSCIGNDGLPKIGSYLKEGYYIISKKQSSETGTIDTSKALEFGLNGVVEKINVKKELKSNGYTLNINIKLRGMMPIMIGDKFSSRFSQKGTLSNFRSINDNFSKTPYLIENSKSFSSLSLFKGVPIVSSGPFKGMIPDIIINPHGQASRMTPGMMEEMLGSKVSLFTGENINSSLSSSSSLNIDEKIKNWGDILEKNGCNRNGYEEIEYLSPSGIIKYESKMFLAPCYYQSLKSILSDSFQYRASGKRDTNKQPITGRNLKGGLKNGEMEKTALTAHAASSTLLERYKISSDKHTMELCLKCGNQVNINYKTNSTVCTVCETINNNIATSSVSYAFPLINRHLLGLGISSTVTKTNVIYDDD